MVRPFSPCVRALIVPLGAWSLCACLHTTARAPDEPPDVVIADFEQEGFSGFSSDGLAFGNGPQRGPRPGQDLVTGYMGEGYATSYTKALDATTGRLLSRPFPISRPYLNFLIGGRHDPEGIRIELHVDGQVVRSATGNAGPDFWVDHMAWKSWQVRDLVGRTAELRVIDDNPEKTGHVLVDQIVMSNRPPGRRNIRDERLAAANVAVARAAGRVARDPQRPIFHITPAAQWMNDPNGLAFHGGYYHVFFQHNPFADDWGHMHWGHVRSRDLVTWERLPIALAPSLDDGESHCYSGCAVSRPDGRLMLIYTSIGVRGPQQWAALSRDGQALDFDKVGNNPLLSADVHGGLDVEDWRDPFVFREGGVYYMVAGGHPRGGTGSVFLYRSTDLAKWEFVGMPLSGSEQNWECPLLLRMGTRWLLVYSPHGLVRYHTGDLDLKTGTFTSVRQGTVDLGHHPRERRGHFYAPNVLEDKGKDGRAKESRWLMFGWLRGFPSGQGWNGALTVPRVLSLDSEDRLLQSPAPELQALRDAPFTLPETTLKERTLLLDGAAGDAYELQLTLTLRDARRAGVKLRRARDGGRAVVIGFDGERLLVDEQVVKLDQPGPTVSLHVFVDRSVMEVFVGGGRQVVSQTLRAKPSETGVELFAAGGEATFSALHVWPLRSIWGDGD